MSDRAANFSVERRATGGGLGKLRRQTDSQPPLLTRPVRLQAGIHYGTLAFAASHGGLEEFVQFRSLGPELLGRKILIHDLALRIMHGIKRPFRPRLNGDRLAALLNVADHWKGGPSQTVGRRGGG